MKDVLNNILRLSLSTTLADRDRFVDTVSNAIEQKMNADPENSKQIAEGIMSAFSSLKDELFINHLINKSSAKEDQISSEILQELKKINESLEQIKDTLKKQ